MLMLYEGTEGKEEWQPGTGHPPLGAAPPGLWQHLISKSGGGRRSQGVWVCDWLAASRGITEWSGVLVAMGLGGQRSGGREAKRPRDGQEGLIADREAVTRTPEVTQMNPSPLAESEDMYMS